MKKAKQVKKMKRLEGKFQGTRVGYIQMLEEADKKGRALK
jgi:hypothetical protein